MLEMLCQNTFPFVLRQPFHLDYRQLKNKLGISKWPETMVISMINAEITCFDKALQRDIVLRASTHVYGPLCPQITLDLKSQPLQEAMKCWTNCELCSSHLEMAACFTRSP